MIFMKRKKEMRYVYTIDMESFIAKRVKHHFENVKLNAQPYTTK